MDKPKVSHWDTAKARRCQWCMMRWPELEQHFARVQYRKLKLISRHHLHAICTTLCRPADANHLEQHTKEMITNQWSMCELFRNYREGSMVVPGVLPIKKRCCCHQTVRLQTYVRSLYDLWPIRNSGHLVTYNKPCFETQRSHL
jgi:hypothetical protein